MEESSKSLVSPFTSFLTSSVCQIELPKWNFEAFLGVLEFLYTGILHSDNNAELLCDILDIADYAGIDDMRDLCEKALSALITVDNVCTLLHKADRFQAKLLKGKCLNFVFEYSEEVVR